MRDDQALVQAGTQGDAAAFAELLRRHDADMRGVVWRVVGSAAAMDDVLQEAYLKAWRSLADYRGESAFSTWLYSIVRRSALDWVRSDQRVRRRLERVERLEPSAPHLDHAATVADRLALRNALAELPADQLAVVTLVDGEGRSYDEVAVLLDLSPGTVGSRLHRARASLRSRLAGDPT